MNCKSVIRSLNKKFIGRKEDRATGRKQKYTNPYFLLYVKKISEVTNHLCSKRLKPVLVSFLPSYENEYGILPEYVKALIIKVSPRALDRIFAKHFPKRLKKGFCTTKSGSIIRKQISLRNNHWDKNKPGFLRLI